MTERTLQLRCDVFVQADRMRLKQVPLNLVSNAIKYNRDERKAHGDCEAVGDVVRIDVRDTGHGLTPDQVDSLFEAFNRLGQDTSSEEGSGIGLVVTKRLVELLQAVGDGLAQARARVVMRAPRSLALAAPEGPAASRPAEPDCPLP